MRQSSYSSLNQSVQPIRPISSHPSSTPIKPVSVQGREEAIAPSWVQSISRVLSPLFERQEPQIRVWQAKRNGELLWSAYDPTSDRGIRLVPEDEMRRWIERQ